MIYTPRSQSVEAAPVELAGQRLMAIALDGKAHLVDAGAFETLFTTERHETERLERVFAEETRKPNKPTAENLKKVKKLKEPPPPKPAVAAPATPPAPREGTRVAQCIQVLRDHGPLTTAELRDHVFGDMPYASRAGSFYELSSRMHRAKQIHRREDPISHLDKWHLCEGVA